MSKNHYIIPIFVPHQGCPHDCVFCNQKKITGLDTDINGEDVDNIIKEYLVTIPKDSKIVEVAFFGGSFTAIRKDKQKELLSAANKYKVKGLIKSIRLSTRPDNIDEEILYLLKENGVDIIELGVQSLDKDVLIQSYRGHSVEDVFNSSKLIKEYGFSLGLQMMIGLPGDDFKKSINTALNIIDIKPDFVRIYPTLVVRDTYLEKMYINKEYIPLSIDEAVRICSYLLMLFNVSHISVIRLGLQATENISFDKDVVSGPFHPAFRQLVESKIYFSILKMYLSSKNVISKEITITINNKNISNLVGQKSYNIKKIKEIFNISKIKIKGLNMPKEYFYISMDECEEKIILNDYFLKLVDDYKTN